MLLKNVLQKHSTMALWLFLFNLRFDKIDCCTANFMPVQNISMQSRNVFRVKLQVAKVKCVTKDASGLACVFSPPYAKTKGN